MLPKFAYLAQVILAQSLKSTLEEATSYFNQGEYSKSLDAYEQAIKLEPTNHVTYYRRAAVYMVLGKNELGIKDLTHVLDIKPDNQMVITLLTRRESNGESFI